MDSLKIMSRSDLVVAFGPGEDTVVFANGVFDLLHPGHVHLLREAAFLGDALVVAVNSDESIEELPNRRRAFDSAAERAYMVAALGCVDAVTIFDEPTPETLLRELVPDIIVKGAEYRADDVVGGDIVTEAGGEIHLFNMIEGYSSTDRVRRIREVEQPVVGRLGGLR